MPIQQPPPPLCSCKYCVFRFFVAIGLWLLVVDPLIGNLPRNPLHETNVHNVLDQSNSLLRTQANNKGRRHKELVAQYVIRKEQITAKM